MSALEDLQIFPSRDAGYLAMQGTADGSVVRARILRADIDALDRFKATIPGKQEAFARANRDLVGEIAQAKIARGEFDLEGEARAVKVTAQDFEGRSFSEAAFNPRLQTVWADRGGRLSPA
jgi:hypothetical protein